MPPKTVVPGHFRMAPLVCGEPIDVHPHVVIRPEYVVTARRPHSGIARPRMARLGFDNDAQGQARRVFPGDPLSVVRASVRDDDDLELVMQRQRSKRERAERLAEPARSVVRANRYREERPARFVRRYRRKRFVVVRGHGSEMRVWR